jgi:glycosyltransferase involved in cell wall biosynthesis
MRSTAYFCEAVCAGHLLRKAGITHVHSVYTTTVAMVMARIFEVKLSMTLHGSAEFVDPEGFAIREKVRIAERTCAISNFGRSQIMLSCDVADWRKLHVTPLGVDVAIWRPGNFRKDPSRFELLTAGRLTEAKGYPLLLDAIAALARHRRDFRLRVVGDGPLRASLENRAVKLGIADLVLFEGWLGEDELRQRYANSDLFVMSSFAEGLPVVLMEAMAMAVPCVAPRIAGIPELIRNGTDGLLFSPSNADELVAHIACLMDNAELRASMSESSCERIAEKYDLLKNTLHLSDVFREWMIPGNAVRVANPEPVLSEPLSV